MNTPLLCLDVGGTEIKGAVVCDGRLLTPLRHFPSRSHEDRETLLQNFTAIIRALLDGPGAPKTVGGLRLAFPGPFDYASGVCLLQGLDKYDALYGVSLRQELFDRLPGLLESPSDIRFINDVAAFGLGETHYGDARGSARSMSVCIGTGCGSAFCVGKELAPDGIPGVPKNGEIYPTPFLGKCIDDIVSKRGLVELTSQRLGEPMEGAALAARVAAGDEQAAACFLEFGGRLRDALEPFLRQFRPECLCVGGQITRSFSMFGGPLQDLCLELGTGLFVAADTSELAMAGLCTL